MRNFLYKYVQGGHLRDRYGRPPPEAIGFDAWEWGMVRLPLQSPETGVEWLDLIRDRGKHKRMVCPRVFVSHRQADTVEALNIARIVHAQRFDVWIDVIDLPPALKAALNPMDQAFVIAAIIEMALINCTHLVAVYTGNTAGSEWVPYEYGRVKDDPPAEVTAASWIEPTNPPAKRPEYLYLAPMFDRQQDLEDWLRVQRARYQSCTREPEDWPGAWDVNRY